MPKKFRMGRELVLSLAVFLVLLSVTLWPDASGPAPATKSRQPLPTRWMAGDGSAKPVHAVPVYKDPLRMIPVEFPAARALSSDRPIAAAASTRILLVVEDSLYASIKTKLQRFVQDLQKEGWGVLVYRFGSGTPQSLRAYLRSRYKEKGGLAGALLIGDIPYIVYEMMQSWYGTDREYEDFPCDIFYMDLDGSWSDSKTDESVQPGNGKYDTRSGDIGLEIWVGRLLTSNVSCLGTEAGVLNNYFEKNHQFRTGKLRTAPSALVYDDDDWSGMGTGDKSNMKKLFSGVTEISDAEKTTTADYKARRMPADLEFIYTRSHGWPGGHGYYRNSKANFEYVLCAEYVKIVPKALFYSFFVCSGCDFTAADNLGGVAAFNLQSGLLAYGSAKTGGIWVDEWFFETLAQGGTFGAAFVHWFNHAQTDYPDEAPRWWYGMILVGDAALRPMVWISGTVKTGAGAVVPGVTITFSGNGGKVVTDAQGVYRWPVFCGWSGTATPKKSGTTFQPASRSYTKVLANKTAQNYKAVQ